MTSLAWGAKVSPEFRDKLGAIAESIGVEPNWLMACMAFESGQTFNPSVRNSAGSGAVGLIQFMPSTAQRLGVSTDALAAMSAEQQLDWVATYFRPFKGRLHDLGDTYMAILWPKAIGKPDDYVLFDSVETPTAYEQNKGLDANNDGKITKLEAYGRVLALLDRGLLTVNRHDEIIVAKPIPVIGPAPIALASAPLIVTVAVHYPWSWPILLAIAGASAMTTVIYAFILSDRHKGHHDIMPVSPEFQADLDAIAKAVTDIAAHEAGEGSATALQAQLTQAQADLKTAQDAATAAAQDKADTLAALNAQVATLESQVAALSAPPAAPAAQ